VANGSAARGAHRRPPAPVCLITPFNNAHLGNPAGGQFPLAPFYILVWMMILTAVLRSMFRAAVS
jgi:hypothetical protein